MGWLASSLRSMMLRRLCPNSTGMSIQRPELSGPPCRMDSSILPKRISPLSRLRVGSIMPAMPRMGLIYSFCEEYSVEFLSNLIGSGDGPPLLLNKVVSHFRLGGLFRRSSRNMAIVDREH